MKHVDAPESRATSEIEDLSILVGDRFPTYRRFWRLDETTPGTPRRWHWPAFLFSSLWLIYRRMYFWGVIWFVLPPLLMTAASLMGPLWLALLPPLASRVLSGLLANTLYLSHCRKLIGRINVSYAGAHRRDAELRRAGGVSYTALVVALAVTASQNTLIKLAVGSWESRDNRHAVVSSASPTSTTVASTGDPERDAAEQDAYQKTLRDLAMQAWPADAALDDVCIVELNLIPWGRVVDARVMEPCTLENAQQEVLLQGIRQTDFTVEGKQRFFSRRAVIGLDR